MDEETHAMATAAKAVDAFARNVSRSLKVIVRHFEVMFDFMGDEETLRSLRRYETSRRKHLELSRRNNDALRARRRRMGRRNN